MRKLFGVALVLAGAFLFAPAARAQFTTVTATVKDPNGIPYAGAVLNAVLVPSTGGGYTLSGQPYSGRIGPVTLDSTGSFTVNFGDVTLITPGSPQWQITIDSAAATIALPLGTGPQTFTFTSTGTTISGSSPVSLSTALNALAPKLTNFIATGVATVSGTSPIVSSGGATPAISCPTCVVGTASNTFFELGSGAQSVTPATGVSTPDGGNSIAIAGPIPWLDPRAYGATGSQQTTTGTISSASTALTLAAAKDFANGNGIVIFGVGPTSPLTAPTISSVTQNVTYSSTTVVSYVSSMSCSSNTVTVTAMGATGLLAGESITIAAGSTNLPAAYVGTFTVLAANTGSVWNQFTFTQTGCTGGAGPFTGSATATIKLNAGSTTYTYGVCAVDYNNGCVPSSSTTSITTANPLPVASQGLATYGNTITGPTSSVTLTGLSGTCAISVLSPSYSVCTLTGGNFTGWGGVVNLSSFSDTNYNQNSVEVLSATSTQLQVLISPVSAFPGSATGGSAQMFASMYAIFRGGTCVGAANVPDTGVSSWTFIDYGRTLTCPLNIPTSFPAAATVQILVTSISAGGGTTGITLATQATNGTSSAGCTATPSCGNVEHDDTVAFNNAMIVAGGATNASQTNGTGGGGAPVFVGLGSYNVQYWDIPITSQAHNNKTYVKMNGLVNLRQPLQVFFSNLQIEGDTGSSQPAGTVVTGAVIAGRGTYPVVQVQSFVGNLGAISFKKILVGGIGGGNCPGDCIRFANFGSDWLEDVNATTTAGSPGAALTFVNASGASPANIVRGTFNQSCSAPISPTRSIQAISASQMYFDSVRLTCQGYYFEVGTASEVRIRKGVIETSWDAVILVDAALTGSIGAPQGISCENMVSADSTSNTDFTLTKFINDPAIGFLINQCTTTGTALVESAGSVGFVNGYYIFLQSNQAQNPIHPVFFQNLTGVIVNDMGQTTVNMSPQTNRGPGLVLNCLGASTDALDIGNGSAAVVANFDCPSGFFHSPNIAMVSGSDYTNSGGTATNVTGLNFPLIASRKYAIQCKLIYQGSATTTTMTLTSTGPASPTKVSGQTLMDTTAGSGAAVFTGAFDGTTFGFSAGPPSAIVTTATDLYSTLDVGIVNGTTAGTWQLQATNGTGTLTIRAGSFCIANAQ